MHPFNKRQDNYFYALLLITRRRVFLQKNAVRLLSKNCEQNLVKRETKI